MSGKQAVLMMQGSMPAEVFGMPVQPMANAADNLFDVMHAFGRPSPVDGAMVRRGARGLYTAYQRTLEQQPAVDAVGSFDNPQEQFVRELGEVSRAVGERAMRGPDRTATAATVAKGLSEVLHGLIAPKPDQAAALPNTPLLRRLIAVEMAHRKLTASKAQRMIPSESTLAVVAPEILSALGYKDGPLVQSVRDNPSGLRWATRIPGIARKRRAIERDVPKFLSNFSAGLPTDGPRLREDHRQTRLFMERALGVTWQ